MTEPFKVTRLSTQKNNDDGVLPEYRFRSIEEVTQFITALSTKYMGRKPIMYVNYGQPGEGIEYFVDSISYLTALYGKAKGVFLRGTCIDVNKQYLSPYTDIKRILDEYVNFYLYKGFLVSVVLFDMEEYYRAFVLINPVSYYDGSKLRTNNGQFKMGEENCFGQCVDFIQSGQEDDRYDYSGFVAYPYTY